MYKSACGLARFAYRAILDSRTRGIEMVCKASELAKLIRQNLPGAEVKVDDLRGDGLQFAAIVACALFRGRSRVDQHRMIYAALRDRMDNLESITIRTIVPA